MPPSDQRPVRPAKEPGRRSRRVAAWPSPPGSTSASRSRTDGCRSRAATRPGSPSASARRSRSSPRITCAATRAASPRALAGRLARGPVTRAALDQGQLHARAALRAHAGGPRLRRLRAGRAARGAGRRGAAAADLRQRHRQVARRCWSRPSESARASRSTACARSSSCAPWRATSAAGRRCASACGRATSSCRQRSDFSEHSVYATAQEYKPGIPTEELIAAGREAIAAPELDVLGLMSHLGRHRNDLETWRAYAASAGETVAELAAAWDGWQPREIDLGGGYAAPRDPNLWVHGGDLAQPLAPAVEDVVEALARGLRDGLAGRVPLAGVALEIEPGRALHADTGIHLTRVVNLKQQREPLAWRWVETDTTEMFLLDLLVEHCHFPVVAATRMRRRARRARRRRRLLVRLRRAGAPGAPAGRRAGRHAGLPRHRRLRGRLRGQLQRAAEARDRARERRGADPGALPSPATPSLLTRAYEDACAANFNALPSRDRARTSGRDRAPRRDDRGRLRARPRAGAAAAMTVRGIDHAGITVASLQAALGFYRDLLGLRVTGQGEDEGPELDAITGLSGVRMRYAELDLGGGQLLELIEFDRARRDAARAAALRPRGVPPGPARRRRRRPLRATRRRRRPRSRDGRRRSPLRAPGTALAASTSRIPTAAPSSLYSVPLDITGRAAETPTSGRAKRCSARCSSSVRGGRDGFFAEWRGRGPHAAGPQRLGGDRHLGRAHGAELRAERQPAGHGRRRRALDPARIPALDRRRAADRVFVRAPVQALQPRRLGLRADRRDARAAGGSGRGLGPAVHLHHLRPRHALRVRALHRLVPVRHGHLGQPAAVVDVPVRRDHGDPGLPPRLAARPASRRACCSRSRASRSR